MTLHLPSLATHPSPYNPFSAVQFYISNNPLLCDCHMDYLSKMNQLTETGNHQSLLNHLKKNCQVQKLSEIIGLINQPFNMFTLHCSLEYRLSASTLSLCLKCAILNTLCAGIICQELFNQTNVKMSNSLLVAHQCHLSYIATNTNRNIIYVT